MDEDRVKKLIRELIIEIGEDPTREGLKDTPRRIASAYKEIFAGYDSDSELSVQFSEDGTRLNSSHALISYAVFCLKKKKSYNN